MEPETVITIKNVTKTFTLYDRKLDTIKDRVTGIFMGAKKRKLVALNNINFEIKKGDFFGIIGSNGSGKSTLVKIISGGIKPEIGRASCREGEWRVVAAAS